MTCFLVTNRFLCKSEITFLDVSYLPNHDISGDRFRERQIYLKKCFYTRFLLFWTFRKKSNDHLPSHQLPFVSSDAIASLVSEPLFTQGLNLSRVLLVGIKPFR